MARGLRRRLTSYGDQDFSWYLRKAFVKAMGFSDDALERPIVGIANTYSDYNPCHGNAPQLIEAAKRGIMLSGGLPLVFPTMFIHESFAAPTSMYLRNLMAMETEELIRAQPMDAALLIGGCDKTLPAQMMAAASGEVPAILLPTGPMATGSHRGERLGACTDCRRLWGRYRASEIDADEIAEINDRLVSSVGTCTVMGTASTMACLSEAMGLSLRMTASAPATSAERVRLAEATGRRAVALAEAGGPTFAEILTPGAFRNGLAVLQALGGSTNGVVHLAAVAGRLGRRLDLGELDALGRQLPVLVDLKPSGVGYMAEFHEAGGVPRLLGEITDALDTSAMTLGGTTVAEIVAAVPPRHEERIIRRRSDPVVPVGAIAVLSGNLAPRGAIIKHSAASPGLQQHEGRAVVFESVEDMTQRLDDEATGIEADDVLVLRNTGPRGAPGMPEAGYLPIPQALARRGVKDMVRISDARMSGTAFGTVVLHVTPESAEGGPLAAVRTGDRIRLDVPARRLDLLVDAGTIAERLAALPEPAAPPARGYARLFDRHVLQTDDGLDFDFLSRDGMAGTRSAPRCLPPRALQQRPRTLLPAGACDCHFHVFRAGLPLAPERDYTPSIATLADWLALADGVGVERGVVVQPSVSGSDNRALLEALEAHPGKLRGVVVIAPDTRPDDIARLHRSGVRGVRISLLSPGGLRLDDVPWLSALLRPVGWHLQVLLRPEHIGTVAALRARHEVPLVIDHLAMIQPGSPLAPRAIDELQRLLDAPGVFVKVSAPYRLAEGPGYPGVGDIVERLAGSHPQRLLWGSDWPHTALAAAMPDDAELVDTVLAWIPDEATRHAILAANPDSVYWSS